MSGCQHGRFFLRQNLLHVPLTAPVLTVAPSVPWLVDESYQSLPVFTGVCSMWVLVPKFPVFIRTPVLMDQGPLHAEGQGLGMHM